MKRATKAALLSAFEGVEDLLYEVVWRDRSLESGLQPADFFPTPAEVAAGTELFPEYLSAAGVDPEGRKRPAGGPGAVVACLRALQPGEAGLAPDTGRDRRPRRAEAAPGRDPRTPAPLPPDARDAGQVRDPGRDGRWVRGGAGTRRSPAGGPAPRSRGVRRTHGGAVLPRPDRGRVVPPLRRRPGRCAARPGRSAHPPLQQRRTHRGRPLSQGAGRPRRQCLVAGRGPGASGPAAGGTEGCG